MNNNNYTSKIKGLQILTVIVVSALLIGMYTLSGNKSTDNLSPSVSTADTKTNSPADSDTSSDMNPKSTNTYSIKDSDKDTAKDKDTDTAGGVTTDSDNSSDNDSITDSQSDADTDTEEIEEAPEGTIFPYRGVWNLIVVNKYNPIPEGYDFTLADIDDGKQADSRITDDLNEMLTDMRYAGIYPKIGEAYRTGEEQQEMMNNYISDFIQSGYSEQAAENEAAKWVAKPGTSEHQLGLALDINADTNYSTNEQVYDWLRDNAYRYGFILRYPQGKESITFIDYEPWHYRYVGRTAAEEIYNSGKCLEEYLTE